MNKAQGRRSQRQAGKYKDRFFITKRNKERKAKALKARMAKAKAKREAKSILFRIIEL